MDSHKFTIQLTSDAEPGTGLGGETVNEFVPRDHRGNWTIRASHLKGLMRQALRDIFEALDQENAAGTEALLERTFGRRDERRPGVEAAFRLTDAFAKVGESTPKYVTRTAVDAESGAAKDTSLRTTEAVPVRTVFAGVLHASAAPGSVEDLAWRLGLLSIPAIGGGRNRGCGQCVIALADGAKGSQAAEGRSPGQLLKALLGALANEQSTRLEEVTSAPVKGVSSSTELSAKTVTLRLIFEAETPICCPEIPDKTNVIGTGFSIPASAVQGLILNRINAVDPGLADQLFTSPNFRAWPLQPCRHPSESRSDTSSDGAALSSIRVSLTHRVAKFSAPEGYRDFDFQDEAILPCDRPTGSDAAPLKASDGVLLRYSSSDIRLWKASDMPHVITAHGVHHDPMTTNGRNLFTVDSMAPMTWVGLVTLPENAATMLASSLKRDSTAAFGKSRTVRGIGKLSVETLKEEPAAWRTPDAHEHTVLVVQSPLLLPNAPEGQTSSEEELVQLVKAWAKLHGLPAPSPPAGLSRFSERAAWANIGIRFGWNRHAKGTKSPTGRLRACRVALPGSVIVFPTRIEPDKLAPALIAGIGEGRERGFGAVSVHPGRAQGLYPDTRRASSLPTKRSTICEAVKLAVKINESATRLPSPSQIRALQQELLKSGSKDAREYLERQLEGRTSKIWSTWEAIKDEVKEMLALKDKQAASRGLAVLANLAMAEGKESTR